VLGKRHGAENMRETAALLPDVFMEINIRGSIRRYPSRHTPRTSHKTDILGTQQCANTSGQNDPIMVPYPPKERRIYSSAMTALPSR